MRLARRHFLQSAGAALIAAPFARLLTAPRRVHAAAGPKRIIFWFTPNGTVHKFWRPSGSAAQFSFPAGSILEPLAARKSGLLILDGLNFERVRGGSHEGGMEHMLTGGGAPSVDQFIASKLNAMTPFPSLELGVQTSAWGASVQTRMSYNDKHSYVHPDDDPASVYRRLFGGGAAADSGSGPSPEQRALDLVRGELKGLQRQLGKLEQQKLDAHLTSLQQLARRVGGGAAAPGGGMCGGVTAPKLTDSKSNERFPDVGELQMDLLVAAAACDSSRVLSLQWTHTVSPTILSWAGASEGHHELSHKDDSNTAGVASFVQSERWFATQFGKFLDKLEAVQEADGSGSLLDTSTVIWVKELGDGRLHDYKSVPFVIAGSGNGYWKLGRYLQLGGAPHQKLLVSLCQSMGVQVDGFGVPDITGALSELSS
ncbi:MAG TPA: DUF1552 domain-containing protein [Polyangiales bacterium]|nr:DUF1552 domain-containing protein [Polyangiales bacterium]